MQTSHFHSPGGGGANKFPHPEAAGAEVVAAVLLDAFAADDAFSSLEADLPEVLGDLEVEGGVLPYLNAMGVDTLDEAAAPPGMNANGAPPGVAAEPLVVVDDEGVEEEDANFFG